MKAPEKVNIFSGHLNQINAIFILQTQSSAIVRYVVKILQNYLDMKIQFHTSRFLVAIHAIGVISYRSDGFLILNMLFGVVSGLVHFAIESDALNC